MDRSNGYEGIAAEFLAGRGSPRTAGIGIGVKQVEAWARGLPKGARVLDLGCGPGLPITAVLIRHGLEVHAIDAAPSLVAAFKSRFPETPIACEAVEESSFFGLQFDAVLAWGLMFLLQPATQHALIRRVAGLTRSGGRFLFTAPPAIQEWNDAMTGLASRSLGAGEYRRQLSAAGFTVLNEYEDEGENHYYDAGKEPVHAAAD